MSSDETANERLPLTGRHWPPLLSGDQEAVKAATIERPDGGIIQMRGGWATISPEWAADLLKGALSTLSVDERVVDHMATDMAALRWRATGEAILLTDDGLLVSGGGRKRLMACVKANVPFVSLILYGIPSDAQDTINNLRGRRLADILHIQGEPNHRSLATVLQLLWRMRDGGFDRHGPMGSDRQLLGFLESYPKIRESLAYAGGKGRLMRLPLFAAMHFLLHRIDHERSVEFFRALLDDGVAVTTKRADKRVREGHAARALNDLVIHGRSIGNDLDRNRAIGAAAISLAWKAFRTGVPVKTLRWELVDSTGIEQSFPILDGWRSDCTLAVESQGVTTAADVTDRVEDVDRGGGALVRVPDTDIMAQFETHDRAGEVWKATFPDGVVPAVELRTFGPREASKLLSRNTANRGKVTATIDRYCRDMKAGRFRSLNGESVKIARGGRLLDAQHRMTALEQAGVTLPFVVVSGLDEKAFEAMDRADTKSYADVLRDRGQANAGTIAAAARMQWFYERDRFQSLYGVSLSNPELDDVLSRNDGILTSLEYNNRMRGLLIPAAACWVEYHLKHAAPSLADDFLRRLASGEELKRGDPILVLRKRLLMMEHERLKIRASGGKGPSSNIDELTSGEPATIRQAALVFIAFTAWSNGRSIHGQNLVWRSVAVDGFPELQVGSARDGETLAGPARSRKRRRTPEATESVPSH